MREELFEEILSLVEEFINELDDETVKSFYNKRRQNTIDADSKLSKVMRDPEATAEEEEAARKEQAKEADKFNKALRLVGQRNKRLEKKLADFKEKLINKKPQTPKQTQQAGSDHANAMIDQHFRKKLEKAFSNECLEEITSLIRESLEEITKKNLEEAPLGSKEWYKAMSQSLKATTAKTKAKLQRREEGKPVLDERPKMERKQATSDYLRRK